MSLQPCAGLICTRCAPHEVVTDAIYDARSICMREFGDAPEVNVFGAPNITFAYVPSHLHHMVKWPTQSATLVCCAVAGESAVTVF